MKLEIGGIYFSNVKLFQSPQGHIPFSATR